MSFSFFWWFSYLSSVNLNKLSFEFFFLAYFVMYSPFLRFFFFFCFFPEVNQLSSLFFYPLCFLILNFWLSVLFYIIRSLSVFNSALCVHFLLLCSYSVLVKSPESIYVEFCFLVSVIVLSAHHFPLLHLYSKRVLHCIPSLAVPSSLSIANPDTS